MERKGRCLTVLIFAFFFFVFPSSVLGWTNLMWYYAICSKHCLNVEFLLVDLWKTTTRHFVHAASVTKFSWHVIQTCHRAWVSYGFPADRFPSEKLCVCFVQWTSSSAFLRIPCNGIGSVRRCQSQNIPL